MSETTDRYALSLLQVAQAQKEITHNDALANIDALLHLAVETATPLRRRRHPWRARRGSSPPLRPESGRVATELLPVSAVAGGAISFRNRAVSPGCVTFSASPCSLWTDGTTMPGRFLVSP